MNRPGMGGCVEPASVERDKALFERFILHLGPVFESKSRKTNISIANEVKPQADKSNLESDTQVGAFGQLVRRVQKAPDSLSSRDIIVLQKTIGNQAVQRLLQPAGQNDPKKDKPIRAPAGLMSIPQVPKTQSLSRPGSSISRKATLLNSAVPQMTRVTAMDAATGLHVQRGIGDGHDLGSPRFAGDTTLEDIYDGTGTLSQGDESASVRKVQHAIHDSGILFLGHGMDGKFGRETTRRVTRFQTRNRITADPSGEVGAKTIEKLDQLFPQVALPANAGDPYTFAGMKALLCQWNSAMIDDLRTLRVKMVGRLEWADERFDGTSWQPDPTPGDGETVGRRIFISTDGTNEHVARTLYHEYQHARAPYAYRTRDWAAEESRVFELETYWAIDRGITADPTTTTTDPVTGETEIDPAGITSTVESYPGLGTATPGEVIGKVGTNRVRVRLPDNRVIVRAAVVDDTVPGPRNTHPPVRVVPAADWCC